MNPTSRRQFLTHLSRITGAVVLMPAVSACSGAPEQPSSMPTAAVPSAGETLPRTTGPDWNALAFNRERGQAGAIPESYLDDILSETGDLEHLGKHLPYVPAVDAATVPEGFLPIMWGDPEKGYARHPNAVRSDANNNEGHWYNWIRVRKATEDEAMELESGYSEWPGIASDDTGAYAVFGDGVITDDGGKNTIYLAAVPPDVQSGDVVRIWAHCLTHGEYVDFLTVP
jgi:hypothetical protein